MSGMLGRQECLDVRNAQMSGMLGCQECLDVRILRCQDVGPIRKYAQTRSWTQTRSHEAKLLRNYSICQLQSFFVVYPPFFCCLPHRQKPGKSQLYTVEKFSGSVSEDLHAGHVIDPSQACFRLRNQIGRQVTFMSGDKKKEHLKPCPIRVFRFCGLFNQ